MSDLKRVELQTMEVDSLGETATESGVARLYNQQGQVAAGKYVVLWKRANGQWCLHRDCWNTDS